VLNKEQQKELDVYIEHMRMALAEAGYAGTNIKTDYYSDLVRIIIAPIIPKAVAWTAFEIAEGGGVHGNTRQHACWTCWVTSESTRLDCEEYHCHNLGKPRRPPRELLGNRLPIPYATSLVYDKT
jgi:hypothetical protein